MPTVEQSGKLSISWKTESYMYTVLPIFLTNDDEISVAKGIVVHALVSVYGDVSIKDMDNRTRTQPCWFLHQTVHHLTPFRQAIIPRFSIGDKAGAQVGDRNVRWLHYTRARALTRHATTVG